MTTYQDVLDHLRFMQREYSNDFKFYSMALIRGQPTKTLILCQDIANVLQKQYQLELEELRDMDKAESNYTYIKIWVDIKNNYKNIYFYTRAIVSGEENKGWQLKSFRVVFAKELNTDHIQTDGMLLIDTSIVRIPKKWEIKIDSEGRKNYPYIYITEYIKFYPDKY